MKNNRVGIYIRLSDEDKNKGCNKSESIINQERLLIDYVVKNNWILVSIYNDEDYSGADKDRPEFKRLIYDCQNNKLDIVLCKTQSRFTRDMEQVEKYLHNRFIEWHVRFISIIDNVDTDNIYNKKTRQINGLVNEWYLEDTSINIRETLKNKRLHGLYTGSFAPYGYQRDPDNKNHLVIDFVVFPIIKMIFSEYANGLSYQSIIRILNNNNVLSPYEYKKFNGSKIQIPLLKKYVDKIDKMGSFIIENNYISTAYEAINNLVIIHHITKNVSVNLVTHTSNIMVYAMVHKKELLYRINDNELFPNDLENIVIICPKLIYNNNLYYELELNNKSNNECIFSEINNNKNIIINSRIRKKYQWSSGTIKKILKDEVYIGNLVQFKTTTVSYKNKLVIKNYSDEWIRSYKTHESIIDDDLWHKVQTRMIHHGKSNKNGNIHLFSSKLYCGKCHKKFIRVGSDDKNGYGYFGCQDKLTKWSNCDNRRFIKETILYEFILDSINKLFLKYYDLDCLLNQNNNNYHHLERDNIVKKIDDKNNYLANLYESYLDDLLSKDEYMSLKRKYCDELSFLKRQLSINNEKNLEANFKEICLTYRHCKKLSRELIDTFIEKIYIGVEYNNRRDITIIWNI